MVGTTTPICIFPIYVCGIFWNIFGTIMSWLPASAFQSFMLGAGYPTLVPFWSRSFPIPTSLTSHSILNSVGRKAWRHDGPTKGLCLWEKQGVWGWDVNKKEGVVLRENYFSKDPMTGRKVNLHPRIRLVTSFVCVLFAD
jgi:hypothetical protein